MNDIEDVRVGVNVMVTYCAEDTAVVLWTSETCLPSCPRRATLAAVPLRPVHGWSQVGGPEDLDGNGVVDFGDLLIVLSAWGPCP